MSGLDDQPRTWLQLVARHAATTNRAVVDLDGSFWTYDELLERAAGAGDWLDRVGAPAGSPVVAFVPAGPSSLALLIAGAATGRPLAPLSPRFTESELVACVANLADGIIITSPAAAGVAATVGAQVGRPVHVVPDDLPRSSRPLDLAGDPDAPAAVVHTSGTTGRPKPVVHTQGPLVGRVALSADPISLGPGAVYATASAFHHMAGVGLCLVALGAGATIAPVAQFAPDTWWDLAPLQPTHATIVPALMEALLRAGTLALPSLRWIQYGSSPLHPDTARHVLEHYPQLSLVQNLGQTEGSPITTLDHADHVEAVQSHPHRLQSVGRPVSGSRLRIERPDEAGVGEICSRAAHYFTPDADGWLRTGDLGRVDDDGFVYVVGRMYDVINRGGEKIYPTEVERVISSHPAVMEAAVVGVNDRRLGQVPHAFVVPAVPSSPPSAEELAGFVRRQLAGFKVPRDWHVVTELPRNPSGKVLRRRLIEDAG